MSIWYFTFCSGDPINGGWCQPIEAPSYSAARQKMFATWGDRWAFQYSEEEWLRYKRDLRRWLPMEKELEVIRWEGEVDVML